MDHRGPGHRRPRDARSAAGRRRRFSCPSAAAAWCQASQRPSSCRGRTSRVVGVEPSGAASMKTSIDAGTCRHPRADAQHRRWPDGGPAGRSEFRARSTIRRRHRAGRRPGHCRRAGLAVHEGPYPGGAERRHRGGGGPRGRRPLRWTGRRRDLRRQPRSRGPAEVQPVEAGRGGTIHAGPEGKA